MIIRPGAFAFGHGLIFVSRKISVDLVLGICRQSIKVSSFRRHGGWRRNHIAIAEILKDKYHHDTSIWRAKANKPKSAFWSAILKVKPLLISMTLCQIADSNSSI
jgi:hypothetical protein